MSGIDPLTLDTTNDVLYAPSGWELGNGANPWSGVVAQNYYFSNENQALFLAGTPSGGSSGGLSYDDDTGTLVWLTPDVFSVTGNHEAGTVYRSVNYELVSSTGGTVRCPLMNRNVCTRIVEVTGLVRISSPGTGTSDYDAFSIKALATFKYNGSSLVQVGSTTVLHTASDASLTGCTLTFDTTTTPMAAVLTVNATSGTLGTAACTVHVQDTLD